MCTANISERERREEETATVQLVLILHFYFPENIITENNWKIWVPPAVSTLPPNTSLWTFLVPLPTFL